MLTAYEGFQYNSGLNVTGQTGGTGWTGSLGRTSEIDPDQHNS